MTTCEIGSVNISQQSIIYDILNDVYESYSSVHPYLAAFICMLGVFMNIASVVVLTRPSMIASPINCLLVAIAACDIVTMLSCFNFVVRLLTFADCPSMYTYEWIVTVLVHSNLSVVGHTVSIWLTVFMAIIRACTVKRHWSIGGAASGGGGGSSGTTAECRAPPVVVWICMCVFALVFLLNLPGSLSFTIGQKPIERLCIGFRTSPRNYSFNSSGSLVNRTTSAGIKFYVFSTKVSSLGAWNDCLLLKVTFWINGVLFKLFPCVLLSVFIGVLICVLAEVRQRRLRLRVTSDNYRTDRTTLMLIVLLGVFLISELPQGVLAIGAGIFNSVFRQRVYKKLGDLMDVLSLINSSANFVVYFAMSQKFREIFCRTLVPAAWRSGQYANVNTMDNRQPYMEMTMARDVNGFTATRSCLLTASTNRRLSHVAMNNVPMVDRAVNGVEEDGQNCHRLSLPTWKR